MYAHLAVHFPKPGHAADLLASMHRVDAAAAGAPGLVQIGAWRDESSGRLVGLALWESAEAFAASAGRGAPRRGGGGGGGGLVPG